MTKEYDEDTLVPSCTTSVPAPPSQQRATQRASTPSTPDQPPDEEMQHLFLDPRQVIEREDLKIIHSDHPLEGFAKETTRNYLGEDGEFAFTTLADSSNNLNINFADPDPTWTAITQLQTIEMADRDFPTFLAEFQPYALRSKLDDRALKYFLHRALSRKLREMLLSQDHEDLTYNGLVKLCQKLDNRYRQGLEFEKFRELREPAPSALASRSSNLTTSSSAPMVTAPSAATASTPKPSGSKGPLTADERVRRMKEGACFYCGNKGHLKNVCPKLWKKQSHTDAAPAISSVASIGDDSE